jgi:(p)ppGpp synthase/HD superfamily hydrolase
LANLSNLLDGAKAMPTLEHAIALAVEAHRGQVDKSGQPYILHPLRIMFRLENEVERIVGVLHDLIEDTAYTFEDLRRLGYPEEVLTALEKVTRRTDESYEEFVARSLSHPVSRRVKLADLEDNMDLRRIRGELTQQDFDRLKRYQRAWEQLQSAGAR